MTSSNSHLSKYFFGLDFKKARFHISILLTQYLPKMNLLSNLSLLGEEEIRNNRDEDDRRKIEIVIIIYRRQICVRLGRYLTQQSMRTFDCFTSLFLYSQSTIINLYG